MTRRVPITESGNPAQLEIKNPREAPPSAAKPGREPLPPSGGHHVPGFISLGQAAFRAMGAAHRARKNNGDKPE
jgi:hypothetical protein